MRAENPWEMRGDDRAFLRSDPARIANRTNAVTVVDLFAGCGGLTLGVSEAARAVGRGFDVRLAVEKERHIAATYQANFLVEPNRMASDVTEVFGGTLGRRNSQTEERIREQVGPLDFLVGGPPCQGHSTLNNHTRGDDPKNRLYLRMARAAEVLRPSVIIIENVPAVERDVDGVVEVARRALEKAGYVVAAGVHSLTSIGVPQTRSRHVMFATRDGVGVPSLVPPGATITDVRDLDWAIRDLEGVDAGPLDRAGELSRDNGERARYLLATGRYDLPNELRPRCQQGAHKYKSMYGRLRWEEPAQTITTGFGSPGQGRYLHPSLPRTITPHEAARLQFFPDWFDFTPLPHRRSLAQAIGNAVPPKLSFVLALAALREAAAVRRRAC